MVRYYFKDRYQTATEALQACQELVNIPTESSSPQYCPVPNSPQTSLGQKTVAVSPANPDYNQELISKNTHKYDPLPLLIGMLLVGGVAALVLNIYPNVKDFATNLIGNKTTAAKKCAALVKANSNIRSEPSSINSDNILKMVGENTAFEVTGRRTQRGWIEIKFKPERLAWAHSDVIANHDQWIACLRDQEIAIQTIDDSPLIASRQIPKPLPKAVVALPEKIAAIKISPAPMESKAQTVEAARRKFDSGDLQGAIATLRQIPTDAVSGIKETVQITQQWQEDWSKAEAVANDINKAIDNGQWDQVLAYREHPEKLPNIKYWRDKLEPLLKQAEKNVANQVPKATPTVTQTP
jgi:serine/threonine-protein kinase